MTESIHPETIVGAVALVVNNLERSTAFYQKILGLKLLSSETNPPAAHLGVDGVPLISLYEVQDAPRAPKAPGLYHVAIRTATRFGLARALYQLAERKAAIQGWADHGVSEAIYLTDPEGNGLEIYCDRPQEEWPQDEDGGLDMGTDELNVDNLLFELRGKIDAWQGLESGTRVGHVHLRVNDLPKALDFYRQVIGLDLMQEYGPSAAFLSAGGYHHHVGANTWESAGQPPAPANAAGLRWYELLLPDQPALDAVLNRIRAAGAPLEEIPGGWLTRDPAGNGLRLALRG